MKSRPQRRLGAIALLLAALAGCGGGGGGGGGGGQPAVLNITSGTLADGVVGANYSQTIAVTGGTGARNFTVSAGALPAGLTLNAATGAITGVSAGPAATSNFTIGVTDSGTPQQSDSQALVLNVVNPLAITTTTVAGTSVGAAYNQTITATGGTAPYVFGVSAGSLPAGITLTSNGMLSGMATPAATTQSFTVTLTDGSSPALTASVDLVIAVALEIVTTSLPNATGGVFYSQTLQAQGGLLPRSWQRVAGSMPVGIADPVGATGEIAGTPAATCSESTATFTVEVSDSGAPPQSDTQPGLSITVSLSPVTITTTTLPDGIVGVPYSAFVQAAGGVPPYDFALFNSALPDGLSLNATTGEISGTPTTVSFFGVQITATDTCQVGFTRVFSMTINAAALGRNDSIASATPLTNGSFPASISPSGHPNTVLDPDEDYYRIMTTQAAVVTIDINAQVNGSPLDSVIEVVGANGVRLNTCVSPAFNSPCVHDDEQLGVQLDSFLQVQVSGPATFYVHVVDWRGDGRPDLRYTIQISGVP